MVLTDKEAKQASEWEEDCLRWRGRVLTGNKAHWCQDWDFLPVDETCFEIEACHCYDDEKKTDK